MQTKLLNRAKCMYVLKARTSASIIPLKVDGFSPTEDTSSSCYFGSQTPKDDRYGGDANYCVEKPKGGYVVLHNFLSNKDEREGDEMRASAACFHQVFTCFRKLLSDATSKILS